jgi:hypothetical protein
VLLRGAVPFRDPVVGGAPRPRMRRRAHRFNPLGAAVLTSDSSHTRESNGKTTTLLGYCGVGDCGSVDCAGDGDSVPAGRMEMQMSTGLTLAIYVLACARVTRLINSDTILDPLTVWLAGRARNDEASRSERRRWGTVLYFVECPWCVGMWVCLASGYVPVHLVGWPTWTLIPVGLAASHLVGVFAFAADTEDVTVEEGQ